jgi:predicted enzyme involved in methoxymalonyl-ACP biosynthesis
MNNKDNIVFSLELNDRFGSNGIVGVLIAKIQGVEAYIDTFLLSCRVIGRTVENAFIFCLVEILKQNGIAKVIGEYTPSPKNSLTKEIYSKIGFKPLMNEKDNSELWMLDLSETTLKRNDWIKIKIANDQVEEEMVGNQ